MNIIVQFNAVQFSLLDRKTIQFSAVFGSAVQFGTFCPTLTNMKRPTTF